MLSKIGQPLKIIHVIKSDKTRPCRLANYNGIINEITFYLDCVWKRIDNVDNFVKEYANTDAHEQCHGIIQQILREDDLSLTYPCSGQEWIVRKLVGDSMNELSLLNYFAKDCALAYYKNAHSDIYKRMFRLWIPFMIVYFIFIAFNFYVLGMKHCP